MFSIEPIVVIVVVCGTAIFMREMPRLLAALIVRRADRLLAARHAALVGALNVRHVPVTWTAAPEDRKLLRASLRSTMRVAMFRSLYPNRR